jgi:hypothetical protein
MDPGVVEQDHVTRELGAAEFKAVSTFGLSFQD